MTTYNPNPDFCELHEHDNQTPYTYEPKSFTAEANNAIDELIRRLGWNLEGKLDGEDTCVVYVPNTTSDLAIADYLVDCDSLGH